MSIHISEVLDYLDTHPVCNYSGSFESFLDLISHIYTDCNPIEDDQIFSLLSKEDSGELHIAISNLCLEYERTSFCHGLLAGMLLMTELNSLP